MGELLRPAPVVRTRAGRSIVSIPNKDYWTRPDHWPTAARMLADELGWIGAALFVFGGYTFWMMGEVALGRPAPMGGFWLLLGILPVCCLAYTIWGHRSPRWRPRG